jgi:hypothetical protein
MADLSDHNGFITKTSGFDDSMDIKPEKGDFEIGVENGEGYIEIPVFNDGETQRFPTSVEAVEQYLDRRNERHPHPTLPTSVDREPTVEAPEGWKNGEAIHTGGGIFCRLWKKETDYGTIEVGYGLPEQDGVTIGLYDDQGEWKGEIESRYLGEQKHDTDLQEHAVDLMKEFDQGKFDKKAKELAD